MIHNIWLFCMCVHACMCVRARVLLSVVRYRISPADGVGYMSTKRSKPVTFHCFLSSQLEAEQHVLLFSRRVND